jgi:hypothetical protein
MGINLSVISKGLIFQRDGVWDADDSWINGRPDVGWILLKLVSRDGCVLPCRFPLQFLTFKFSVLDISSHLGTNIPTIWMSIVHFMKRPFLSFSCASFFWSIRQLGIVQLRIWIFRPLTKCLRSGFEWRTKRSFCSSKTAEMWSERQSRDVRNSILSAWSTSSSLTRMDWYSP